MKETMMKDVCKVAGVLVVLSLSMAGCATRFSSQVVRSEIVRQTGESPKDMFELNVGRVTMTLARQAFRGSDHDGKLPLAGLTSFELSVYELSPSTESRLDFTEMAIRGWEPTLRFREGARSGVVLVRTTGDTIGDLVLLAAGDDNAIYTRLRGTLSPDLPAALGDAVKRGGPDDVRRTLESLTN